MFLLSSQSLIVVLVLILARYANTPSNSDMSDSDEQVEVNVHVDSPPSSNDPPTSPLSHGTVEDFCGSDDEDFHSDSSASIGHAETCSSPPSSPIPRRGHKRSYGAYKEDSSQPIPRQTLHRWKQQKLSGSREAARLPDDQENDDRHAHGHVAQQGEPQQLDGRIAFHQDEDVNQPGASATENDAVTFPEHEDSRSPLARSNNGDEDSNRSASASEVGDVSSVSGLSVDGSGSEDTSSSESSVNEGSSSDDECDVDYVDPFDDSTLYPGCEKTKDEAIYELLDLYVSHNFSKKALAGVLKFFNSSLPDTHNMPTTGHNLLKYIKELSMPLDVIEHYYCRPTMHAVGCRVGPCQDCASSDIGIFYELSIESQLKFLFENRGLADLIDQYCDKRRQRDGNNDFIEDILDGSEYVRLWLGILHQYKVTLITSTDGVRPHKSSKAKFWPLMATIMEVPPHLRAYFTIVWGIWFDKKLKPTMNLYLKPFVAALIKIHDQGGISWTHPRTQINHVSPVRGPVMIADAPARAAVLNMKEHQSKYACNACEQKTSKLPAPPVLPGLRRKARKRRFVFKEELAPLRTHDSMVAQGTYAEERGIESKKGFKGTSVVQDLPGVDLSTYVLAEYVHCVLMGVVKQICSLWFFKPGDWNISGHLHEIIDFLCSNIHPPDFISRLPRSLENFSYFKANEFRSFLLYYSVIVVGPYLEEKYLQHWMLLVQSIFLLLGEAISEIDLLSAEAMLRLFVRDMGVLYGDEQYTYNVHQLIHLVLYTRRWGCLWSNSAFGSEGMNGVLSKMIHSSHSEGRELINSMYLAQGAQILKSKIMNNAERAKTNVKVLGKPVTRDLTEAELDSLEGIDISSGVQLYGRILVGRETYSCKEYDKNFKRRNSYVEVKINNQKQFGRIIIFCKIGNRVMCLISVLKVVQNRFFFHEDSRMRIKHIIPVEDTDGIAVCEVKDMKQKVIQVGDFLCIRPNKIEGNL